GDFGGANLRVEKGRIGTKPHSPYGSVTVDLDAQALDGVLVLVEKFAPRAAERLRHAAAQVTPVRLRAELEVRSAASSARATAKYKIDGDLGRFKVALQGNADTASDAFRIDNLAALGSAKISVTGRMSGDNGAALLELFALDQLLAADKGP